MRDRAFAVFLLLVLLQGVHELEHVIQVVQRSFLGIPNGNGMLGSLVDIEPLHFAYNTIAYVPALAAFTLIARRTRPGLAPRIARAART